MFAVVPDYPELKISDCGNILINTKTNHTYSFYTDRDGYKSAHYHVGKTDKNLRIHQLVAGAFLGECPKGYVIDHIDRNPANNDFHNLRYVTLSEQNKNRDYTIINKLNKHKAQLSAEKTKKKIVLDKGDKVLYFDSVSDAIQMIAKWRHCSFNAAKRYFYLHKNIIMGWKIKYL